MLENIKNLKLIKQESLANKIAIIRDQTAKLLIDTINKNQCKSILEIGTGFGYSALLMLYNTNIDNLTTIEKDKYRFNVASNNLNLFENICLINTDCKQMKINDKKFDFIFMDGPKAGQEEIINNLRDNMIDNCIIFIDNIFLKKIRNNKQNKNNLKLIQKLDYFVEWIKNQHEYSYEFVDIDDGIAILRKK